MNFDDLNRVSAENAKMEDVSTVPKELPPKIVSTLKEKAKQAGGKLTWGDLDRIIQSFGIENDTDEIEEILSICEREGIAIINEDLELIDVELDDDLIVDNDLPANPIIDEDNPLEDIDMNVEYSRIDSGIRIDRYHGSAKCVTIPSQIDNLPVTSIGDEAFWCCESLTEITIPDSVTSIGDCDFGLVGAFSGCKSLREIKIPYSVISIGNLAFSDCESLREITIPEGVTSIGNSAFGGCKSLREITIPEGVTSIGNSAFSCCKSLTKITIPEGVTSIGKRAFDGCEHLEIIYIDAATLSRESIKRSIDAICKQNPSCKILSIPKE